MQTAITLGETKFNVPPPRGMRSFSLQQRILPVAGRIAHVLLQLAVARDGKEQSLESLMDANVASLLPTALPSIGEIFAKMPEGELEAITRALLLDTTFNGAPLFGAPAGDAFDAIMAGRTLDTWRLLWHAMQVWYPDFFTLAAGLTGGEKKASPSAASTT
jgi:hypothetical protein